MKFEFIWDWLGSHSTRKPSERPAYVLRLKKRYIEWWHGTDDNSVQKLFLYEHVTEFFDAFERKYIAKILEDISFILSRKWAYAIWEQDFYHGHICGKSKAPIKDLETLLSPSNVCFLYHTFEHQAWRPEAVNRNILSFLGAKPTVVHPQSEFRSGEVRGVDPNELNLALYAKFCFKESTQSRYRLEEDTKLEFWGVFP